MSKFLKVLFSALLLAPSGLLAQTGRIVGAVTDSASRAPLSGAQLSLVATAFGTQSGPDGSFVIDSVPPGTYTLRVHRLGTTMQTISGVTVSSGADTRVDVALARAPLELAGVVVSASRRVEKITDAPATITRIDARQIENTVGNSYSGALKAVEGVDFVQLGVTSIEINTRGFNSSFNNRVLMMEDGRIAVLPEYGQPTGSFTTIPKIDLNAVEVLVGPGAALYGPDASNGVLTLETKDAKQHPGTTIEVAAGTRKYRDIQGRQAGTFDDGRFGYKLTGEYQSADDFSNQNTYAPVGTRLAPELNANWNTSVARGAAAFDWYRGSSRLEASVGASRNNGIGQTNVGRNQLANWQYRHAQLKYTSPHLFGQVYTTASRSGDTFVLNTFAQNSLRYPGLSVDSIKKISAFPGAGDLYAAEIQNNFTLPVTGTHFTYGGQFRHDVVSSHRHWLADRLTGENIQVNQRGVYAQLEQPVLPTVKLIGAGRYDKHDYYDAQWSPKAGVLFTPALDQTFRFTFNRAFKSPTVLQTRFYFPDFSPLSPTVGVGVIGNYTGLEIRDGAGNLIRSYDPVVPETNTTYELGYKGVVKSALYVDVAAYRSFFRSFLTPLVNVANPLANTFAYANGRKFGIETGRDQFTLTYLNLGKARIDGVDLGLRWLLTPRNALSASTSWQHLKDIQVPSNLPKAAIDEATAFNSPTFKWAAGLDFDDIGGSPLQASFDTRHVAGYNFRSGVNFGHVPTFTTFDMSLGYKLPLEGMRLNASLQNFFTCRSGRTVADRYIASGHPSLYVPGETCGFGKSHSEMINMPPIGGLFTVGVRWDR
ncbi:MAG TPA: TonB-dependent receptor [Gemmatimonadaceae bacterium]|nr:TonB-dependent receptor [Gemmatimonadaceae bacterium]